MPDLDFGRQGVIALVQLTAGRVLRDVAGGFAPAAAASFASRAASSASCAGAGTRDKVFLCFFNVALAPASSCVWACSRLFLRCFRVRFSRPARLSRCRLPSAISAPPAFPAFFARSLFAPVRKASRNCYFPVVCLNPLTRCDALNGRPAATGAFRFLSAGHRPAGRFSDRACASSFCASICR